MRILIVISIALHLSISGSCQKIPKVRMQTALGEIIVEVDTIEAPVTAKNFPTHVATFGRVVKGMEVVRKIQQLPDKGQYLKAPVKVILSIKKE